MGDGVEGGGRRGELLNKADPGQNCKPNRPQAPRWVKPGSPAVALEHFPRSLRLDFACWGSFLYSLAASARSGGAASAAHPRPPPLHVTPTGQSAPENASAGARGPAPGAGGSGGGRHSGRERHRRCRSSRGAQGSARRPSRKLKSRQVRLFLPSPRSFPPSAKFRAPLRCLPGSREGTGGWKGDVGLSLRPQIGLRLLSFGHWLNNVFKSK